MKIDDSTSQRTAVGSPTLSLIAALCLAVSVFGCNTFGDVPEFAGGPDGGFAPGNAGSEDGGATTLRVRGIVFEGAEVEPAFDPSVMNYDVTVPTYRGSITVRVDAIDGAGVMIGEVEARETVLMVEPGTTELTIEVERDAESESYLFALERADADPDYLKASNIAEDMRFGASADVDGEWAVVGARLESTGGSGVAPGSSGTLDQSGAVYLYRRGGQGEWAFHTKIKAEYPGPDEKFGTAVALEGDLLAVGVPGERGDGSEPPVRSIDYGASGAVYLYRFDGTNWGMEAYLKAPMPESLDLFGTAVAVADGRLFVGATGTNSAAVDLGRGSVFIFEKTGEWSLTKTLDGEGQGTDDQFGFAVAATAEFLVVGAPGDDSAALGANSAVEPDDGRIDSGAAYVFRNDGAWTFDSFLKPSNEAGRAAFGESVAIANETIVVGAPKESSSLSVGETVPESGAAYLFQRAPAVWEFREFLKADEVDPFDSFGSQVAIDADTLAVGMVNDDRNAVGVGAESTGEDVEDSGVVFLFDRVSAELRLVLKAPNTEEDDGFGATLALDGALLVCSPWEDSGDPMSPSDDSAFGSGACFVYDDVIPPSADSPTSAPASAVDRR